MEEKKLFIEKSQPLYLRIYELLRDSIVIGDFYPGEEMIETKLANQLGVSRTPIRDALRQLIKDGLVIPQGSGAARVFSPTVNDVAEIYLTRAALEAQASAIVGNNIKEYLVNELEEIVKVSENANEEENIQIVIQGNTDFHQKIIQASKNTTLIKNIEAIHLQIMQIRRTSLTKMQHRSTSLQEHREIIEALKGGDANQIHQIVSSHIIKAGSRVVEQLGVPENPSPSIMYLLKYKERVK